MSYQIKEIEFVGGKVQLLDQDIFLIQYEVKRNVVLSDVIALRDLREELIGNREYYPIVDLSRGLIRFSDEAKAWTSVNKESAQYRILDIFLVKGFIMKMKVKLYHAFYKPNNPSIIVTSLEKALEFIENDRRQKLSSGKKV